MTTIKLGSKGTEVKILQHALSLYEDGIFGKLTEEAVIDFQKEHGLIADGVVGQMTWKTLGITDNVDNIINLKTKTYKRTINEIIVHCTATPEGKDYTVNEIRKWHLKRGFSDIGYHFVIYRDGSIHAGRSIDKIGAHCTGHNTHSIGVCYVGGLAKDGKTPKDTRTPEQKAGLKLLLRNLKMNYKNATIHGHRDYANKACPCFNATREYAYI